jgi:uncharacterized damage-inducible protein DinB
MIAPPTGAIMPRRASLPPAVVLALALTIAAPLAAQSPTGYRAEVLREVAEQESHFVSLAEAMPAEKYAWRPAEGVRSVSEVFLHVAAANFNLPRRLGKAPPDGFRVQGYEKSTTEKAQVVAQLRASFAHLRAAIEGAQDANLEQGFPWIGGTTNTQRGLMLFIAKHTSEHLGQSIAYARMNGVVPPWSQAAGND